jgi:hypothetical protein
MQMQPTGPSAMARLGNPVAHLVIKINAKKALFFINMLCPNPLSEIAKIE